MQENKDYIEIDLLHILQILLNKAWAIILAAILFGGVAFGYSEFIITPTYQSTAMLYVNNSDISFGGTSLSISSTDISAAKSLVDTYIVILKTRTTLDEVIDEANLDYSYDQLKGMISASAQNGTEIFGITVTSSDPQEAKLIANTIAKVLPKTVERIVDGSSVRVVDYAVASTSKAGPNVMKYTAIGMLLGIVLSVAVIIILDFIDDQIHDCEYLRTAYPEVPLLSVIPDLGEREEDKKND